MLTRRSLIQGSAAATLFYAAGNRPAQASLAMQKFNMITPPRLQPNDWIAIVAPAGASSRPGGIDQARANVESLGFRVRVMPNAVNRWGYLAGTDEERAADFNAAVLDPEVKGIFCLRGGYGTMRMLPLIDYIAFRKFPKIVLGYSDITGLLNALTRKSGVVTYHGPIAESKFEGFEGDQLRNAVFEGFQLGEFPNPTLLRGKPVFPALKTIQAGRAKGRLIGGNLSLVAPLAGTPYGPIFDDSILFLEDINEDPYKVDRMLTSLYLGGHLEKVKGIVLGDFRLPTSEVESDRGFSMEQVFENLRMWSKVPIFSGLHAGHISDKLTLTIGSLVEMDADLQVLKWLE